MRLELFLIAIANGCAWSGLMDGAFPHLFHQLSKPFGCSKCMSFWSMLISVSLNFQHPIEFMLPFVSMLVAAFGFRTFTMR